MYLWQVNMLAIGVVLQWTVNHHALPWFWMQKPSWTLCRGEWGSVCSRQTKNQTSWSCRKLVQLGGSSILSPTWDLGKPLHVLQCSWLPSSYAVLQALPPDHRKGDRDGCRIRQEARYRPNLPSAVILFQCQMGRLPSPAFQHPGGISPVPVFVHLASYHHGSPVSWTRVLSTKSFFMLFLTGLWLQPM